VARRRLTYDELTGKTSPPKNDRTQKGIDVLILNCKLRYVVSLFGILGKVRYAMALGRRTPKNAAASSGKPGYIRTAAHDGSKYVDLDEFVKDREIREQFKKLARQAGRR
jgi:hypothetical protein